jgi:hypothetical protein
MIKKDKAIEKPRASKIRLNLFLLEALEYPEDQ